MKIAGIDISKWQGDLNFTKVRDEGFDFAIIRAGSGTVAAVSYTHLRAHETD